MFLRSSDLFTRLVQLYDIFTRTTRYLFASGDVSNCKRDSVIAIFVWTRDFHW